MTRIWVDADGCPMKTEIYREARRHDLAVTLVANHPASSPGWVEMVVVDAPGTPDAADQHILRSADPGDIVVTDDLPLAQAALARGLHPLSNRGTRFVDDGEGGLTVRRDPAVEARETGGDRGGPLPVGRKDRSAFRAALRALVASLP